MQEKFALRKTLKKIAAVGTSLAMVGVTLSGALAANLGDYGTTFSKSNTVVVFGEAGSDSVAVSDVVSGLPGAATTATAGEVVGSLTIDDFEEGELQDFEPGTNMSQSAAFGKRCFNDNDDLGLADWEQNININTDADYDAHEEFCFGAGNAVPHLTTSLHEGDDDLGLDPIIFIPDNGLNYTIVFEENLAANNRISNASTSNQVKLENFLGKQLIITGSSGGNQITALVGEEYQLHSGETVVQGDCTVEVVAIDANEVLLNVNGDTKSVNENENERFSSDCEVHVDSAIETTDGEGIAVIFVGDQASETFRDSENAPGEDDNHFLWEWDLANLDGSRPVVGLQLAEDLTSDRADFEDEIMDLGLLNANRRHLKVGDYVCLPNYYECLILEGPKTEVSRCTIDFNADGATKTLPGFANVNVGSSVTYTNANVLDVKATGCGTDQGFRVDTDGSGTVDTDTDRLYLFWDSDLFTGSSTIVSEGGGELLVYYENSNGNITLTNASTTRYGHSAAGVNGTLGTEDMLFEIDNDDFDNAAVVLWEVVNGTSGASTFAHYPSLGVTNTSTLALIGVELDDEGGGVAGGSAPRIFFEARLGSGIPQLGNENGEDTTKWLRYASNATNLYNENKSISSFDEDVLSLSGIIVRQPEDNYNDDRVILDVPSDDEFEWFVRVAKPKAGVVSTSGTVTSSSTSMSDEEVGDVTGLGKNVVVVGGPAVNKVTADLLGVDFPTYGADLPGLEEGLAVLEMRTLTNGKDALLAYGWEQDDTRRAAVLLKDPSVLAQKLEDAGLSDADSATVTGTDLSVAGITVSA